MGLVDISSLGYGNTGLTNELPQAIKELQSLTFSGPLAGAAANTPIVVADGITKNDTIAKVLEFANGVPSDITGTVTVTSQQATGQITLAGVVAGDSIKIGGVPFNFMNVSVSPSNNLSPGVVPVGGSDTATANYLASCITEQVLNVTATAQGAVIVLSYNIPGTAGNAVTIDVTKSNAHVTSLGATFANGSNTSAIVSTAVTTGNTLLLIWYKKPVEQYT